MDKNSFSAFFSLFATQKFTRSYKNAKLILAIPPPLLPMLEYVELTTYFINFLKGFVMTSNEKTTTLNIINFLDNKIATISQLVLSINEELNTLRKEIRQHNNNDILIKMFHTLSTTSTKLSEILELYSGQAVIYKKILANLENKKTNNS